MSNCMKFMVDAWLGESYPGAKFVRDNVMQWKKQYYYYVPGGTVKITDTISEVVKDFFITTSPITINRETLPPWANGGDPMHVFRYDECMGYSLPTVAQHKRFVKEYPAVQIFHLEWLRALCAAIRSNNDILYLRGYNMAVHGQCKGVMRVCLM